VFYPTLLPVKLAYTDELAFLDLKPLIELLEHETVIIFVPCKDSRELYPEGKAD